MNSSLVSIKYRSTDKIDLEVILNNIISEEYYQTATIFEEDIEYLKALRFRIYNITNDLITTTSHLETLQNYALHLQNCLIPKFPNDLFSVTWYGNDLTYSNENQPTRFKSLKFELINMAFNLGAAYSQLGMSKNNTDENIKKSCNYFQISSGCFTFTSRLIMKYNDLIPHLPSDIDIECINFLKWLMLAQAQELIWIKAKKDSMKDTILARLSKQASIYYENAMIITEKLNIFKTSYYNYVHAKKFHFEAVAQYRYALVCGFEQKHGNEVSRLRQSFELSNKSLRFLKLCDEGLASQICEFNSVLKGTLDSSEKENDLIYLTLVPPFETLEPIQPAPMVKPIIPAELEFPNKYMKKPLFQDLLPFYVIQTSQAFRERQESYVKESFNNIINKLNVGLDNFLSSHNLPACIDSLEDNPSLPHTFVVKLEEIKNLGGIQRIESTIHDIEGLKTQSYKYVDGCKHRLELEFNEDSLLRERYGTIYWNRQPSSLVGKALIDEIEKLDNYLILAKHGDKVIEHSYLKIKDPLRLLSQMTPEDLSKMLQENSIKVNDLNDLNIDENRELHASISELRDLISESENLKAERKSFLSIIDIKSTRMTIFPKIVEEYKVLSQQNKIVNSSCQPIFEKLYEDHISGFKPDLQVVQNEKIKQEDLKNRIEASFKEFFKLKKLFQIKSGNLKEEFLTNLQNNYDDFIKLVNNLDQAVTFYNSFLVKCTSTITMIDKYIDERRIEARDLESKINNISIKDSSGNHSKIWNQKNGINFE